MFETVWILSLFCCAKILLEFPRTLVELGGSGGWFIPIISALFGFIGLVIIILLLKRFPGQTIVEAGSIAAGPIIGNIAALSYMLFFIFSTAMVLREFSESIKVMSLPITPFSVVIVSFMLIAAISAYLGIEVLARTAVIIAITMFTIIVLVITVSLALGNYNINYIFPLLGKGPDKLVLWGMIKSSSFSELLFAGLIINSVGGHKHVFKAAWISIILTTLVSSIVTACIVMTLNISMTEDKILPLFRLIKEIYIGRFFQRVEGIFVVFFVTVGLLYCSFGLYSVSAIFARMAKIKYYKPLVPAFAIIILFLALLPHDINTAFKMDSDVLRRYSWIVSFGVPFIILLIAIVRKKKTKDMKTRKEV